MPTVVLTSEQAAALAALAASFGANPPVAPSPNPPVPWYDDTTGTPKACDPTDTEQVKINAAHGLRPNMRVGTQPKDLPAIKALIHTLAALPADVPSSVANSILPGAGQFAPDVTYLLMLGGGVQGDGIFSQRVIYAPWSGFDFVAAGQWLDALPGEAGPGY